MIVPMKKVAVFALRSDREAILLALQRASVMMIIENDLSVRDALKDETEAKVASARDALSFLGGYRAKKGLLSGEPEVGYDALVAPKDKEAELCGETRRIAAGIAKAETDVFALKSLDEQLAPWLLLDIPVDELSSTKTARVRTGYIPASGVSALRERFDDIGAYCEILGPASGSFAVLAVCHKSDDEQVTTALKELSFIESAPPSINGTARAEHERLQKEIEKKQSELAELKEQARAAGEQAPSIELLYDKLATDLKRYDSPYSETESTFWLEGWIEEAKLAELDETLREATDAFEIVAEEPAEDETPPTLVKNNKLVSPFETLTDMFSRPNPKEGIDPNPAMAPWYWIIFGMMMADAGYGLVMAILFTAYLKIKKPHGGSEKLIKVLNFASITTAFWGVMFGSYFGAEWFPPVLFAPLYNPLPMMIMCFVIGALHIFCGMLLNMKKAIDAGDVAGGIFDNLTWIILLTGLGLMLLPATAVVGKWMAIAAAAAIVLMSKRDTMNPIKRLGGGLLSLYGITNYISDILSYSRILALMLSSGVVAMVMNMLAGMVFKTDGGIIVAILTFIPSLAIYFAGHVFNLVMGLLSAYVHASRLQYIEFYGKFYEGGGHPFQPLSADSRYNAVTEK